MLAMIAARRVVEAYLIDTERIELDHLKPESDLICDAMCPPAILVVDKRSVEEHGKRMSSVCAVGYGGNDARINAARKSRYNVDSSMSHR